MKTIKKIIRYIIGIVAAIIFFMGAGGDSRHNIDLLACFMVIGFGTLLILGMTAEKKIIVNGVTIRRVKK
jgi:hypothetical protein